jgi:hypothetical protein
MPHFNLDDYETVESRIKRFYETYPDGRLITELVNDHNESQPRIFIIKSYAYLTDGDQAASLPKATGYAFEIDGGAGANKLAALENAETSSLGRCLANMGMSGNKRASREEMAKANRVAEKQDWLLEASKLNSVDKLRRLYIKAQANGATVEELAEIKKKADDLTTGSKPQGNSGGVPSGDEARES